MGPPKKGELIKGQASLANFFSGGGLTPAAAAAAAAAAKKNTPSTPPEKDKAKSDPSNGSGLPKQEVEELKNKITVAGYKASPSVSPQKPVEEAGKDKMPPATSSSKYFSKKSKGGKSESITIGDSSDEDVKPVKRSTTGSNKRKQVVESDSDLDFQPVKKGRASNGKNTPQKPSNKPSPKNTPKGLKKADDDDDDFDDDFDDFDFKDEDFEMMDHPRPSAKAKSPVKAVSKSTPAKAKPAPPVAKVSNAKTKPEDAMEVHKDEKESKPKFNWAEAKKRKDAGPAAPGSKEIPIGKPNCLAGLTMVFTGELSSLSREEATDLAKRYGAKVTSSVSSKTSFIVMGADAGKSKIEKQKQLKTKVLDEDGFLNLIAEKSTGPVKLDEATKKKLEEERKKIQKAAAQLQPSDNAELNEHALWTVRYAPRTVKDLVGNGTNIAKLQEWLRDWPKSLACGFKKPGKNATNTFRAILISGPPGIGKTSAAHIVAKMEGFTPIEFNASDVRSKKLIEAGLTDTINNTSLDSWYSGGKGGLSLGNDNIKITDRTVLIMDEVDGMSGGDRGGVGAINALVKKTKVPIICICNDSKNPKMKPMERTAFQLKFTKPDARAARTRLMTIAVREKLDIEPEVMEQLVQSAQSDIRLVINMLATWALDKKRSMNFDEGKQLGAANVKPGMHTPFSLYSALSAPGLWAATSKKTINDKTEYYFQDHSFVPLMVQQNYINLNPASINVYSGKEREVRWMQTITRAAESISEGDLVDRMIHSSEQHWSLMPLHGVMSCVRPMAFAHGSSSSFPMFSSFLGQNSKQQRLTRAATELQARMRLVTAASRFEVREQYVPYFFPRLIQPLLDAKQSGNADAAVSDIVDFMDDYYLTLEDRDIILELGMDGNNGDELSKKIPTATKSAFTRKYNAATHPVAFYKGTDFSGKAKKLVGEPAPDVEEAVEAEEVPEDDSADGESDGEIDVSKDKFFKQKTAKGKGKAKK